jgi:hypothetical protein
VLASTNPTSPSASSPSSSASPVRTVREWRQRGGGPPFRKLGPGKAAPVRYPIAQYRAWRQTNILKSTAERLKVFRARTD